MPKHAFPAAAEGMPTHPKSPIRAEGEILQLIRVTDLLVESRGFCRCAWQAASSLDDGIARDGMVTVLNMVEVDVDKALEILGSIVERIRPKGGEA